MEVFFYIWFSLRVLFIGLLFFFILSGLDDLFVDAVYYLRVIFRRLFRRDVIHPVTIEQLESKAQQSIAILIPAWDESNVIGSMLRNTLQTVLYHNYYIFIGTYPNDEATRREIQKVREEYANVEFVITPANGPTNKADCLNWILQGIHVFEKEHNIQFDIFLMHDAEDVIHPLSLLYYNSLIPKCDFIQLPVFPFMTRWHNFTHGVYMDEFAENHAKEMRVREMMAQALPSAGVGTALSRRIMDYMAAQRDNQVFDVSSVTEDYLMGVRLKDFPGKKIFLQQAIRRDPALKSREPIATREYFPGTFRASIRQKSRWILGISLQGWRVGWTNSLGSNYFLFRDRKAILSNFVVILGYVIVLFWIGSVCVNHLLDIYIPPLVDIHEPYAYLVWVVLFIFLWRISNRIYSSGHIYGPLHGFLALPRLFWGNIINFTAAWLALKRYIHSLRTGTTPAWGKTEHAFPTEAQLRGYHKRLGDILMAKRMIKSSQLHSALEQQKTTGKRLGEILVENGALRPSDLEAALQEQDGGENSNRD